MLQQPPDMTWEPDSSSPGPANMDDIPLDPSSDIWDVARHRFNVDILYSQGASGHSDDCIDDPNDLDDDMQDTDLFPQTNSALPSSSGPSSPKALPAGRQAGKDPSSSSAARPQALPWGPRSVPLRPVVKGRRAPKRQRTVATDIAQQDQQPAASSESDAGDHMGADHSLPQSSLQAGNSIGGVDAEDSLVASAGAQQAQHEVYVIPERQQLPSVKSRQPRVANPKAKKGKAAGKQKSGKPPKPNQRQRKTKSGDAKQDQLQQLDAAPQQQLQKDDSDDDVDDLTASAKPAVFDANTFLAAAAEISSFLDEMSE